MDFPLPLEPMMDANSPFQIVRSLAFNAFGNLHSFQNFVFHKMSPFDAFFRIKEKTGSKAAPSQNPISRMLTRI